jgi:hypothetical protein
VVLVALTLNREVVSGPALNTGGSNCACAEAARQAVARTAMEDLKIDILEKFLVYKDDDGQAICSLHTCVRGLPNSHLVTTRTAITWRLSDFN